MIGSLVIFLILYLNLSNAVQIDTYYGTPITEERMQELTAAGLLDTCTINIEPCDESGESRVDGSCNNPKYPSFGAAYTPQIRFLDAVYGENFDQRTTKSGKPLILPRVLRQATLKVGKAINQHFTQFLAYFAEFAVTDCVSVEDTRNYLRVTTHCCEESGKSDYMCKPNVIPEDDPVHRFSGYRCMNQTRPFTFQNKGCAPKNSTPVRMDPTTVSLDLSTIYNYLIGYFVMPWIRTYEGGHLKTEMVNGKAYPSDGNSSCTIQDVSDTGCTRNVPNGLIGTDIFNILFWRQHNLIADAIAELNPHYDDNKLFEVSRKINIGIYQHIILYEFWPPQLGENNMIKKGIISKTNTGHRDMFDEDVTLQLFTEYSIVNRWYHTIQEGRQYKMTSNGTIVGHAQVVDFSLKVESLTIGNDMETLLNGASKQPGGGHDYVIDPEIADNAVGSLQRILDLGTQDINKNNLFASAPYIQFRDKCTNYKKKHETFEDLEYIIPTENLEIIKTLYEYPEDIDLMTGINLEKHIEGGYIPDTAACVIMEQLKRTIVADKFWYENSNVFTAEQLHEIRKSSLARLVCDTGNDITHIQPKAFLRIGPDNEVVSCEEIPKMDLSAWKENTSE